MILRLLFATICSLFLLGVMPYLNKPRTTKEKPIVSYRLHSFEAKLVPPTQPEPEPQMVEKIEKEVEVLTTIPKPVVSQTEQLVPRIVSSELSFSSSAFAGSFSSAEAVVVSNAVITSVVEGPTFQIDGSDHLLYAPKPIVPLRAKQLGLSGSVNAQWEVNELGQVENIKIINSSNSIFDKGVIQALKQYRFKPYTDSDGKLMRVTLTKEFQIEVH